jgi:hypothetical protein
MANLRHPRVYALLVALAAVASIAGIILKPVGSI